MTSIGPSSSNPYGVGGGASIASQYGIQIQGGTIAGSVPGAGTLGSGQLVYMGTKRTEGTIRDVTAEGKGVTTKGPKISDDMQGYDDVLGLPALWAREDPKKLQELINKGIITKIPGFDSDMGMPEVLDAWKRLVDASVELGSRGMKWSPWDIMETYGNTKGKFGTERRGDFIYDIATDKPVKYVGPKSKTTKSSRINLSSSEDVRAIAMQALREALGRAPTPEEVSQFTTSINAMERTTPEVTTTTTQLRPNLETGQVEAVSEESTTSGGVSQAAIQNVISTAAEGTDEYAKYQGGTTFFNALLSML